ncbi:unnamed protein product [Amaranthus hypochondriacus]
MRPTWWPYLRWKDDLIPPSSEGLEGIHFTPLTKTDLAPNTTSSLGTVTAKPIQEEVVEETEELPKSLVGIKVKAKDTVSLSLVASLGYSNIFSIQLMMLWTTILANEAVDLSLIPASMVENFVDETIVPSIEAGTSIEQPNIPFTEAEDIVHDPSTHEIETRET